MGQTASVSETDFLFPKFINVEIEKHIKSYHGKGLKDHENQAGVGLVLATWDGSKHFIKKIEDNSPAQESGQLMPWDELVSVDDHLVSQLSSGELCGLIRGRDDTPVTLRLRRYPAERLTHSPSEGAAHAAAAEPTHGDAGGEPSASAAAAAPAEGLVEVTLRRRIRAGAAAELGRFLRHGLKATMSDTRIGGDLLAGVPPHVRQGRTVEDLDLYRPTYLIV